MKKDCILRREKTSIWEKETGSLNSQRSMIKDEEWRKRVNRTEHETKRNQDQSVLSNLKFQRLPSWF